MARTFSNTSPGMFPIIGSRRLLDREESAIDFVLLGGVIRFPMGQFFGRLTSYSVLGHEDRRIFMAVEKARNQT